MVEDTQDAIEEEPAIEKGEVASEEDASVAKETAVVEKISSEEA